MRFHEKLQKLRKEKGLSQEALGEMLRVSRQSVSKWESGQSYPEMDKLISLCEIFGVTMDGLVKDGELDKDSGNTMSAPFWMYRGSYYEYKSKRTLFGLPLVHVHIGPGRELFGQACNLGALGKQSRQPRFDFGGGARLFGKLEGSKL